MLRWIPLVFLWAGLALPANAQTEPDSALYRIETRDGNEYIGRIVSQDQRMIVLNTQQLGTITIQKIDIKSMIAVQPDRIQDGRFFFDNPQSTRYLWQPNGYGLKKGEAYYQNVWIFFNQASYGVTDNFTIGAGIIPLFLFAGASTPAWITPKFSVPVVENKFNVGAGALLGTVLGEPESGFGIAYGISTFGSRDKNFSVGLGYGYAAGEWADTPLISFSGMIRTGERGYFLTENYLISSGDENLVLLSFGGRRIVKRVGIDFALVVPTQTGGDVIAIPILGLTVPFGNVPGRISTK